MVDRAIARCGIMVGVTIGYEVRDGKAVWAGRELREWIPDLVAAVLAAFDPVQIIVFGSVASGTDGPDSDLDVLVVLDDAPLDRRRGLMVELRKATRTVRAPRDLLVTSQADFVRDRAAVGSIEHAAFHGGRVVHERRSAA